MPTGKIPTDFPHVSVLNAADVNTFKQLSKFEADYTQIPGIGPTFAADIIVAVRKADKAEAAAAAPPVETKAAAAPLPPAESHSAVVAGAVAPRSGVNPDRVVTREPKALKPTPCKFHVDRDTIVDADAFGIDPESGVAEHVDAIVGGRFRSLKGVRAVGKLVPGDPDTVGCYALLEKAGASA